MISDEIYLKIEKFLNSELPQEEMALLEEQIKVDPQLKEQVEIQKTSKMAFERLAHLDLINNFKIWDLEETKAESIVNGNRRKGFIFTINWYIPAIAASLIAFVFIGISIKRFSTSSDPNLANKTNNGLNLDSSNSVDTANQPSSDKIVDLPKITSTENIAKKKNYNSAYESLAFIEEDFNQTLMGPDDDEKTNNYLEAVKLYQVKEFEKALSLLIKIDKNQLQESLYLRGYVYYKLRQYEKAEADFAQFRKFKISDRKIDAMWCEVFCLVQLLPDSKNKLKALLEYFTQNPDNFYFQRAEKLQIQLNLK